MSQGKLLYNQGDVRMTMEERNNKVRGKFRHLARRVSREVFDVPEENQIIFIYEKQFHVGQMSFSVANLSLNEPGVTFDTDYFPQVSFLFVHQDFQGCGFGRLMLNQAFSIMTKHCATRPVRLQSAFGAVPFFEKCGFKVVGTPIQCFHSGSRLFKTLVNMELEMSQA